MSSSVSTMPQDDFRTSWKTNRTSSKLAQEKTFSSMLQLSIGDYRRLTGFVPPQPWTCRHARQYRASYWENRERDRRGCPGSGESGYPEDEEDWTFGSLALGPC